MALLSGHHVYSPVLFRAEAKERFENSVTQGEPEWNGSLMFQEIGSDAGSPSLYIRKRGEGELAVRAAFADAILIARR